MGIRLNRRTLFPLLFVSVMAALVVDRLLEKGRVPKTIRIGEITPLMNFSRVRVEGVLIDHARELRSGTRFYVVDDGTGALAVFDGHPSAGPLPRKGAMVSAAGHLKIAAGNDRRMQADTVEFQFANPLSANFGSDRVGESVTFIGRVVWLREPGEGSRAPCKITLENRDASIDVVYWLDEPVNVSVGDVVKVTGVLSLYQGRMELKITDRSDVSILD